MDRLNLNRVNQVDHCLAVQDNKLNNLVKLQQLVVVFLGNQVLKFNNLQTLYLEHQLNLQQIHFLDNNNNLVQTLDHYLGNSNQLIKPFKIKMANNNFKLKRNKHPKIHKISLVLNFSK